MSEDFLTVSKVHECQSCITTWTGTPSEFCSECEAEQVDNEADVILSKEHYKKVLAENAKLKAELAEAKEVIKRVEDLATGYYCQKSEYEESVEIPYWDIIFALNIKEKV